MIEIKTDRLILKKPKSKQDILSIVSQIGDWEVVKWLAMVPYPYTYNDCESYLKESNNNELALNIFLDNQLIGGVGLHLHNDNYYELGYWLGKDYWGKGYATESSKYLLEYALGKLDSPKIKSGYFIDNLPSGNVLKKLGFKEVGIEKRYSDSMKKEMDMMKVIL
jgi:RimJ/RimL family protein N-acetyltransferase|tara:strand:+ start:94 stop:588 length:495 start_codon:yes stop_codon:yes gene_type:complete